MWDLGLVSSDSPKDVVSGKIKVFVNILSFPGVNWAQKWTKAFNFGYVPFLLKHLILNDCLNTVFNSGRNFSKLKTYFGEKGLRNPPKGAISWMLF